jgi:DNA mismatch repair protein MutS
VRPGYSDELDAARALRDESRKVIASLQAKYQEMTGIRTLKVRHNNVLGYFVETTAQHAPKLSEPPLGETFFHRQTLASQVRFSTAELVDLEGRIASAADRALALESEIYEELVSAVGDDGSALDAAAAALGVLDVHAALAALAVGERYVSRRSTKGCPSRSSPAAIRSSNRPSMPAMVSPSSPMTAIWDRPRALRQGGSCW